MKLVSLTKYRTRSALVRAHTSVEAVITHTLPYSAEVIAILMSTVVSV